MPVKSLASKKRAGRQSLLFTRFKEVILEDDGSIYPKKNRVDYGWLYSSEGSWRFKGIC